MRIEKVLHTNLLGLVEGLHAKRADALTAMVCSLVHGAFVTVTSLGRRLHSSAKTKHNIKRADRTLSNKALQRGRCSIYRALCVRLCAHLKHPVILVDWSDIAEQKRLLVIRAALIVDGRALPLYEEVFHLSQYNKPRTHRAFLKTLKSLLPAHCVAIIVTDAGFRGPWFKAVEAQGWYWLGRVRNCINYRTVSRRIWRQTRSLYGRATSKPQYLGECELSSRRPYRCHLYLYKKTKQYRRVKRSTYNQAKHSDNEVFARQQREPWLLATNLDPAHFKALHIVRLYAKSMGIEAGVSGSEV